MQPKIQQAKVVAKAYLNNSLPTHPPIAGANQIMSTNLPDDQIGQLVSEVVRLA